MGGRVDGRGSAGRIIRIRGRTGWTAEAAQRGGMGVEFGLRLAAKLITVLCTVWSVQLPVAVRTAVILCCTPFRTGIRSARAWPAAPPPAPQPLPSAHPPLDERQVSDTGFCPARRNNAEGIPGRSATSHRPAAGANACAPPRACTCVPARTLASPARSDLPVSARTHNAGPARGVRPV